MKNQITMLHKARTESDRLLTEQELAEFLGISKSTLRRWRKAKQAPPVIRLGHGIRTLVRFQLDAVLAWLQERTTAETKGAA